MHSECRDPEEWDVSEIAFVDDMMSFAMFQTLAELEQWIETVIVCFESCGMAANIEKLEIVLSAWGKGSAAINKKLKTGKLLVHVRGVPIVLRTSAKYLGVQLTNTGSDTAEVTARISAARTAFNRLKKNVFSSKKFHVHQRLRAYKTLCLPVLLYGLETLVLSATSLRRLENFYSKCIRHITRDAWTYDEQTQISTVDLRDTKQFRKLVLSPSNPLPSVPRCTRSAGTPKNGM